MDVLAEALRRGGQQAREDHVRATDTETILCAAEVACDEALRTFVPLNERAFREVFTLAWSAGYRAECAPDARRGRGPTIEGTGLHG